MERLKGITNVNVNENENYIYLEYDSYVNNIYLFIKTIQDKFFSLLALIVLMPFLILISIIIYIDDPKGSPIFSQIRCGKNGKLFKFYKFRSMYVDAEDRLEELMDKNEMDGPAFKIKNDPRITRIGGFLRKSGIDELPQLINILRGDMSIVGPRPALPREVEQYNEYQLQSLSIQPGLTCYWQIQPERNNISFDEWVELDIKYIQERSFLVHWKLIFMTVLTVIRETGL